MSVLIDLFFLVDLFFLIDFYMKRPLNSSARDVINFGSPKLEFDFLDMLSKTTTESRYIIQH